MDIYFTQVPFLTWMESMASIAEDVILCRKCPRLVEFRESLASRYGNGDGWCKPVPGSGTTRGRLLVVGLAPAISGANRTGRILTGDKTSDFLFSCLYEKGFSNLPYSRSRDDGLMYFDIFLTAAVKCVPPENKPQRQEIDNCLPFLKREIVALPSLRVILVLGRLAHESVLRAILPAGKRKSEFPFYHGNSYGIGNLKLYCSYHPSPRNVNTGTLNREMLLELLDRIREDIQSP